VTSPPRGTVAHFAINAVDVAAAQRFYAAVFGWRFDSWGPPGFFKVTTAGGATPGPIGALQERRDLVEGAPPVVELTVAVDDVDRACVACVAAGGQVLMPKTSIPGVGELAFLRDPSGIAVGAMRYQAAAD
jgi:predicted enzyme related to lactoylglutathione lyase